MKIKELQDELKKNRIDFALFLNVDFDVIEPNIVYFSGYSGIGALVIPAKQAPFLVVPEMEYNKAKKTKINAFKKIKDKRLSESIFGIIKKRRIRHNKIAIDCSFINLNAHKSIKKIFKKTRTNDVSEACLKLRAIKTSEEVKKIRKACRISDKILNSCIRNFKNFKTESEAKLFLEYEAKKQGCGMAFKPIVASGNGSSTPHYDRDGKIKEGFCVIDFGVKYRGYCSDTTRTIHIGKISRKKKELYGFLLHIQEALIEKAKAGISGSELFNEAKKMLGKYQKNFNHGLGHGLGIKIHELPNITDKSQDKLQNKMIFTIEPGVYFKNFGIRIEDTILLDKKAEVLTKIPKDLLVISKL